MQKLVVGGFMDGFHDRSEGLELWLRPLEAVVQQRRSAASWRDDLRCAGGQRRRQEHSAENPRGTDLSPAWPLPSVGLHAERAAAGISRRYLFSVRGPLRPP